MYDALKGKYSGHSVCQTVPINYALNITNCMSNEIQNKTVNLKQWQDGNEPPFNPEMEVEIKDFVGVFKKAYTKEWCDHAIKYFDEMTKMGFGRSIQEISGAPRHLKDTQNFNTSRLYSQGENLLSIVGVPGVQDKFLDTFWACYNGIYRHQFSSLQTEGAPQMVYEMKIQRTAPGEGYHVWHWEQSSRSDTTRFMVIQVFLNDVEDGGETEFLYYPRRLKAEAGTLLIFPGNYTHTHRGNQPLSGPKYTINTWLEF